MLIKDKVNPAKLTVRNMSGTNILEKFNVTNLNVFASGRLPMEGSHFVNDRTFTIPISCHATIYCGPRRKTR